LNRFKRGHRDANQPQIEADLRAIGASVVDLSAVGFGCPDLLVGYRDQTYLMEIKDPSKPKGDQKLKKGQLEFHGAWKGRPIAVIKSSDEAFAAMGLKITLGR
jgi:hypothetical protein